MARVHGVHPGALRRNIPRPPPGDPLFHTPWACLTPTRPRKSHAHLLADLCIAGHEPFPRAGQMALSHNLRGFDRRRRRLLIPEVTWPRPPRCPGATSVVPAHRRKPTAHRRSRRERCCDPVVASPARPFPGNRTTTHCGLGSPWHRRGRPDIHRPRNGTFTPWGDPDLCRHDHRTLGICNHP